MLSRILVTGATGHVGRALIPLLLRGGWNVRLTTRNASAAGSMWWPQQKQGQVEAWVLDFDRPEGWTTALSGVDTLFVLSPSCEAQVSREKRLLHEADRCGVGRVVRLSVLGANPKSDVGLGRQHGLLDRHLQDSSFDYAIVRPHYFMQNLEAFAPILAQERRLRTSAGEGAIAMINVDDIAAACSRLLEAPDLGGKVYSLTGSEAVSFPEIVELLSKETGKALSYEDCDRSTVEQELRRAGFSEWLVDSHATLFEHYRKGRAAKVLPDFQELVGRAPTAIRTYLRKLAPSVV